MLRSFNWAFCSFFFFLLILEPVEASNAKMIYKEVKDSIIVVKNFDSENKIVGLGSGFFVRPNVVATNYHVLENASHVTIKLSSGKETTIKFITGMDMDLQSSEKISPR